MTLKRVLFCSSTKIICKMQYEITFDRLAKKKQNRKRFINTILQFQTLINQQDFLNVLAATCKRLRKMKEKKLTIRKFQGKT